MLLVIFMATLPLSQQGLDTTVPSQTQSKSTPARSDQIVVQYDADGQVSINQQPVTLADLPARLNEIFVKRTDKTMYIFGAATLRYGAIVRVIDAAKGAGVSRVGVITTRMRSNG